MSCGDGTGGKRSAGKDNQITINGETCAEENIPLCRIPGLKLYSLLKNTVQIFRY
jgi:hypothetical protein